MSGQTQHSPIKTSNLPDKLSDDRRYFTGLGFYLCQVRKKITCLNSLSFLFCLQVQLNYQYSASTTKQRLLLLILNLAELIDLVRLVIIYITNAIHVFITGRLVKFMYFRTVRKIVHMQAEK